MPPADFARRIDAPGVELLRGAIVEAVDVDHQKGVGLLEIRRRQPVQDAVLVDGMKQGPAQHAHRMFGALARRSIRVGWSWCMGTTGWSAKTKRARGREKRAKINPVITARNDMP